MNPMPTDPDYAQPLYTLAEQVTAGLEGMEVPLRVAVMGCVVNGPGDARAAALGVASGYPRPDGMVLWTRLLGDFGPVAIPVRWLNFPIESPSS